MSREKSRDKSRDDDRGLLLLTEPDSPDDLLAELADAEQASIVVFKVDEKSGAQEQCFTVTSSDYANSAELTERVRTEYGPGRYVFRGLKGTKWHGQKQVRIAARAGALAVPGVASASTTALREEVKQWTLLFTPLITAIIGRPAAPPLQGLTVADAIALSKLNGGKERDPLADFQMFLELQDRLADRNKETGATFADVALEGLASLKQIAQGQGPAAPATPAITAAPPAPASAAAPQHPLAPMVNLIVKAAEKDSDQYAYAVILLDTAGEVLVTRFLTAPDPVAMLAAINPKAAQHREWLLKLVAELRELLSPEAEEGEQQPGAPPAPAATG